MDRTKTERLISLLRAQRGEAARRSGEVRGSRSWTDSSDRLDNLNRAIMRVGSASLEPLPGEQKSPREAGRRARPTLTRTDPRRRQG